MPNALEWLLGAIMASDNRGAVDRQTEQLGGELRRLREQHEQELELVKGQNRLLREASSQSAGDFGDDSTTIPTGAEEENYETLHRWVVKRLREIGDFQNQINALKPNPHHELNAVSGAAQKMSELLAYIEEVLDSPAMNPAEVLNRVQLELPTFDCSLRERTGHGMIRVAAIAINRHIEELKERFLPYDKSNEAVERVINELESCQQSVETLREEAIEFRASITASAEEQESNLEKLVMETVNKLELADEYLGRQASLARELGMQLSHFPPDSQSIANAISSENPKSRFTPQHLENLAYLVHCWAAEAEGHIQQVAGVLDRMREEIAAKGLR